MCVAPFCESSLITAFRRHHSVAPGVVWKGSMALAGRQVLGKRRMAAAKRSAAGMKPPAGARSAVKVAPLDLAAGRWGAKAAPLGLAGVLPEAIPPVAA